MKTGKLTLALAALMITSAAFISSCKKKTNETKDTDTSAASDNNLAETTSNDVVSMTGQASENGSLSTYKMGAGEDVTGLSCATVTLTGQILTATFSGGVCLDGRTRSGILTFDYSASPAGAHYRTPGFTCHVTSTNYVVDGNQVSVNKTIVNTTSATFNPATTNLTWSINGNVTIVRSAANGGGTITWNCTRTKTLMNTIDTVNCYHGQSTPISWSQAKIGITGSANGTTAKGENFNASITSQLVRDMKCVPDANRPGRHPFIQGTLDFTPGSKATRHIDYGNGSCDFYYTVTINGITYNLTMN